MERSEGRAERAAAVLTGLGLKPDVARAEFFASIAVRSLGESEYFAAVDLGGAKLGETRGLKLVRFDIDAKLVNPALKKQPEPKPARQG